MPSTTELAANLLAKKSPAGVQKQVAFPTSKLLPGCPERIILSMNSSFNSWVWELSQLLIEVCWGFFFFYVLQTNVEQFGLKVRQHLFWNVFIENAFVTELGRNFLCATIAGEKEPSWVIAEGICFIFEAMVISLETSFFRMYARSF